VSQPSGAPTKRGPLGDIRVIELATGIGGAYAGKLFADAGADVVIVEPAEGAPLRGWVAGGTGPSGQEAGDSRVGAQGARAQAAADRGALFEYLAGSKRSVVADPTGPEVTELVTGADLVIEELSRDALETIASLHGAGTSLHGAGTSLHGAGTSLHGASLHHAGLVVLSITPYGRSGPWADRPATEFTVQAESGSIGGRGRPDGPPVQAGGRIAEWASGAFGAAASLAAVRHAMRTGRGAHIDVSMQEVMCICTNLFQDLMVSMLGRPALPQPPRSIELPSIERTADGWVGFNTNSTQMFKDFLVLIERGDLCEVANLRSDPARRTELEAAIRAWTTTRTTAEIIEQASLFRIPVGAVTNGRDLPHHEHLSARGVFTSSASGSHTQPKPPYLLNGERRPSAGRAPACGEHTGRVEARSRPATADGVSSEGGVMPLDGLKVLDITCWWAGPGATQLFAALGADVIHVESVQRIDGMRPAATIPFADRPRWWEYSPFFLSINVNKRDITLDLGDPRGRQLAECLVAWSDLVVENYTPRVMEGFGLGWPAVQALNPRAVMLRMPAYGLDGPWRDRVGFAQTIEAMSGMAWVTGFPDGPPTLPRGPCDPIGAMHAAFAAQVGLAVRDASAEGVLVEAPLIESALNVTAEQVLAYSASGTFMTRTGNRSPGVAPQGVYQCSGTEQWLALSVTTDEQWQGLRSALGAPDWATPDLDSHEGRRLAHDRIDDELAQWAGDVELGPAVELLVAHGVPAASVVDPRAVSAHQHLRERGFFEVCEHPVVGSQALFGMPFRYSGIDTWARTPAPTLGQHNAQVLSEILGLGADEIDDLIAARVIGDRPL